MFATLVTVALFFALTLQGALAEFAVSTPEFTQCQDAHFSWEKTNGPYNIILVNPQDPCGDAIADLGDHDSTTMTWKVALPAGMKVQLSLEDADGEEAWSGEITVKDSSDSSCVPPALVADTKSASVSGTPSVPAPSSARTTLVLPATTLATTVATSSAVPTPVGAANAGSNPINAAPALRQVSTPFMVMTTFIAVIALSF